MNHIQQINVFKLGHQGMQLQAIYKNQACKKNWKKWNVLIATCNLIPCKGHRISVIFLIVYFLWTNSESKEEFDFPTNRFHKTAITYDHFKLCTAHKYRIYFAM